MLSWEEMSRKEQLECIVWDAYKDAHGVRPRHMNLSAMTEQELEAELDYLGSVIEANEIQRQADESRAAEIFEKRVKDTIALGAGDRENALRWIHTAEGTDGDDEYLCYTLGLKYGYFKSIETV